MTTKLPLHLHPAYNWTDSAGELDELRVLTGDRLAKYCLESAINAREHDEDVSASDLLELAEWLKDAPRDEDEDVEDEEDVDVQVEVTSVRPSSEGDYEAQVSITVGDETYEGTVTLREDTSRPSGGRRLGTCGAPLDGWASDRVIDALAAAEGAGLDRVAIVGEIEAHVTEAAARA